MEKNQRTDANTKITKTFKFLKILFAAIILFLILFFIIGEAFSPSEWDVALTDCKPFVSQWEQITEGGKRIPVPFPGRVDAQEGEVVTLATTLPENITNGMCLCFHPIWQDVEIYIDGALRQSYSTVDSRPFGTNSAFRYVFVDLKETDAGKELTYSFSSNSKYAGRTYPCFIGDRASIWIYLAKAGTAQATISISLLIISTLCIFICSIMRIIYKKHLAISYLAWTIFFVALWMLSETSFRQLIFKNVSIFSSYTYWSLMMISFPMLLYINDIQKGHYAKVYLFPTLYSGGIFIVGTLLQIFDIVQFVDILSYIHVGSVLAIVAIIATITIDTVKKRIYDYLFVGIGIYILLLSAVVEIILYYVSSNIPISTVLSIGLLVLFVMAVIMTCRDLLYDERKKQKAVAAREAQARFLANMSHEIRTPINVVVGMNELILRETQDKNIQEYAHNVQSASNMLLGLISDVLDFSKIESGQLELVYAPYSLSSLIHDITIILNTRIGERPIAAHVNIEENLPDKLYGDELRIKQILTNLISNAVKYTPSGSVSIKVSSEEMPDNTVRLDFAVSDTGIGIKQEDLTKLFDSFKRLDLNKNRHIEGTGLGLNISKQLAELMQGTISVESEYGKGSCFTLSICQQKLTEAPSSAENTEQEKPSERTGPLFTAPDAEVLVIDDNAMNLVLMKGLLKRTEIQITTAKSGAEGLELTKHKKYDLIFLDHMMPDMDGVETLHILRSDASNPNRDTITIALTANAIAGCREMYLEYGFNDYFAKPIQTDKLEALLLQYLPPKYINQEGTK